MLQCFNKYYDLNMLPYSGPKTPEKGMGHHQNKLWEGENG
jgi:hypothetical protein